MKQYLIFAAWTLLAGAGIPLIGVLNSGMARSVGNPFAATTVMFAIAMTVAVGITLPFYGHPTAAQLGSSPLISWGAGLLIGFYALSATAIIPRFGAARFVAYILIAQLLTSTIVDHFGLFTMERRPLDMTKLVGLAVIIRFDPSSFPPPARFVASYPPLHISPQNPADFAHVFPLENPPESFSRSR